MANVEWEHQHSTFRDSTFLIQHSPFNITVLFRFSFALPSFTLRPLSYASVNALFGRFFMLVGLIILPIGLSYGLAKDDLRMEERLLFIGAAFFLVGWLMARTRRR